MSAILDRNQPITKQDRKVLFPQRVACPPFWIEINQSENSSKMSCFRCGTLVRHFGSHSILKLTNEERGAEFGSLSV